MISSSAKWQDLSSDLLQLILDRISSSILDLLSFSAVCTSWRSFVKSSLNSISPPPLLLFPLTDDEPWPTPNSMCLLRNLTRDPPPRTFRSRISKRALNRNCCGCSYGHLIFASSDSPVLIVNIFSSTEFRLPKPPRGFGYFAHGVLTAPPSSSSSMLILISLPTIICCKAGAEDWSVFLLGSKHDIASTLVSKGKLHVLHTDGRIFAFDSDPPMHWKRIPDATFMKSAEHARLAECDRELFLVCFMRIYKYSSTHRIELYKMDFGEGVWVRVESIGDWCLFMDSVGKCSLARRNPEKWGVKKQLCFLYGRSVQLVRELELVSFGWY